MGNYEGESRLYVANIGKYKCINLSQELNSILWDRINKGASIDDVMELYCDISQLDVMSNLEIDAAKRENPANNTMELKLLKKKYDVRDEKDRHIRPLFFKYIDGYKGYRDDYYVYIEQDDEFQKLFKTDKYKDAQTIKKESANNIVIERGRMSYLKHETSMDYLQKCINRFHMPRDKEACHNLSYILVPVESTKGKYQKEIEQQIVDMARSAKREIGSIWENSELDKKTKRELAYEVQERCCAELQEIQINEKTMRKLLGKLEDEYSDVMRFLFFALLEMSRGFMLSSFHQIIQKGVSPVGLLREDNSGDVCIYDFRYLKVYGGSEEYDLYYQNQAEFASYVRRFLEKYGIRQDWLATQLEIDRAVLSRFLSPSDPKDMSKSNYFNLLSFIRQYEDGMKWLELA